MDRQAIDRTITGVVVIGFAIGTTMHVLQLVNAGWIVFADAPTWMNVYWAALTLLDPLAVVLLLRRRTLGLMLGLAVMLSDVGINSYAFYGLNLPFAFAALQLQTLFGGFLLGAIGFLISKPEVQNYRTLGLH